MTIAQLQNFTLSHRTVKKFSVYIVMMYLLFIIMEINAVEMIAVKHDRCLYYVYFTPVVCMYTAFPLVSRLLTIFSRLWIVLFVRPVHIYRLRLRRKTLCRFPKYHRSRIVPLLNLLRLLRFPSTLCIASPSLLVASTLTGSAITLLPHFAVSSPAFPPRVATPSFVPSRRTLAPSQPLVYLPPEYHSHAPPQPGKGHRFPLLGLRIILWWFLLGLQSRKFNVRL